MCHWALAPLLCQQFSEQEDTAWWSAREEALWRSTYMSSSPRVGLLSQHHHLELNTYPSLFNSQSHTNYSHSTLIILTPLSSLACQSRSISIVQITITGFYHLFVMTPPEWSRILPELSVLCAMNLVLWNLVNGPEWPQTILILH